MKYKVFIVLAFFANMSGVQAQAVPKGNELQELVRVSEVYGKMQNLNFTMLYTFADSLYPNTLVDSSQMSCKISRGRSFSSNSDVEYLQGKEFVIYVSKDDSTIMVSPAQNDKNIFKVPLFDSVFRKGHVTEMGTWTINDSTRKLTVTFRPESHYVSYVMLYDPRTSLVKSITYCTRNRMGNYGIPADHILKATIVMSGYNTTPVDAVLFNEARYVYRLNGKLYLQAAWEGYRLMN